MQVESENVNLCQDMQLMVVAVVHYFEVVVVVMVVVMKANLKVLVTKKLKRFFLL